MSVGRSREDKVKVKEKSLILVANEAANSVSVIDANDLILQATIPVGEHPHEVASSPNGKFALVSNFGSLDGYYPGRSLTYIDLEKKQKVHTIMLPEKSRPHGIAFLNEERVLVTAEGLQTLYEVNVKNGDINKIIPVPGQGAHLVVVDQAKHFAYVTCRKSGTACRINLKNTMEIDEIDVGDKCEGIMLSSDNKRLFVTSRADNTISVIDAESFTVIHKIKTARGPLRIAEFDHGNAAVVTNCISGNAQIIDLNSYEVTGKLKTYTQRSKANGWFYSKLLPVPLSVVVREDQTTAYITNMYAGKVGLVDLKECKVIDEFEASQCPDGLSLSKYQVNEQQPKVNRM